MSKPYVVTEDISHILNKLGQQGIALPDSEHEKIAADAIAFSLRRIYEQVDIIPSERIIGYLTEQAAKSDLPAISMTGVISEGANVLGSLCFSRSVTLAGVNERGYNTYARAIPEICPRSVMMKPLSEQFRQAAQNCSPHVDVALIDDVVFSGSSIITAARDLAEHGIHVKKVYASIVMRPALDILKKSGIEAFGDYIYDDVADEVCMRDFIVGCPEGGRNVIISPEVYASAPYIYPFGDVEKWASIEGGNALIFSRDALHASKALWQAIDDKNGRSIQVKELSKPIVGWNADDRISDKLDQTLRLLPNF